MLVFFCFLAESQCSIAWIFLVHKTGLDEYIWIGWEKKEKERKQNNERAIKRIKKYGINSKKSNNLWQELYLFGPAVFMSIHTFGRKISNRSTNSTGANALWWYGLNENEVTIRTYSLIAIITSPFFLCYDYKLIITMGFHCFWIVYNLRWFRLYNSKWLNIPFG